MADVNVPELVARALDAEYWASAGYDVPADSWETADEEYRAHRISQARDTLTALRSPDVEAGIARVLRDAEDEWRRLLADAPQGHPPTRSQWQAAAVVDWLAGGGA